MISANINGLIEIIQKEYRIRMSRAWNTKQYIDIADPITRHDGEYSFLSNEDGASKWKSTHRSDYRIYLQNL